MFLALNNPASGRWPDYGGQDGLDGKFLVSASARNGDRRWHFVARRAGETACGFCDAGKAWILPLYKYTRQNP
ncbi:MAG: hypothetical protein A2283_08195 [Lentisphaerae bacterium RIFOXYA12_FULL_48_11]|nr:MAG: hypothetical protein A2283_08195 [Lentisphaerae bacterium RIFOXYA12_FULL_48_11]